jgi:predicted secreted protein
LLKRLNLHDSLLTLWRDLATQEGGEVWRPSVRELLTAQKFLDAGNKAQAAYALTGFRVPAKDRETVADVVGLLLGVRVGRDGGVIK